MSQHCVLLNTSEIRCDVLLIPTPTNMHLISHQLHPIAQLVIKNGLKKEIIKEAFESKKKRDEILEKNQLAYTMGITGVPLVTFNDQVAVQGAESTESIIEKIKKFN